MVVSKCENLVECKEVMRMKEFDKCEDNEVTKATVLSKCDNLVECKEVMRMKEFDKCEDNEVTYFIVAKKYAEF
jgi:hypothetical protein